MEKKQNRKRTKNGDVELNQKEASEDANLSQLISEGAAIGLELESWEI